jgi:hypothetical protein
VLVGAASLAGAVVPLEFMHVHPHPSTSGTIGETVSALHAEKGVRSFFKGWHWRTGRMICAMFIMGECKDVLSPLFFPQHFE